MNIKFLFVAVFLSAVVLSARATDFAELMRGEPGEKVVYRRHGDLELVLHVFRPGDIFPPPHPAVVLIHGGGWIGGTPEAFMHLARYFASRGMVACNITYRLVKPDGPTMVHAVEDCREALRFIRREAGRLQVDPGRIAVLGDSAGGHLAAALGTLPVEKEEYSSRPDAMLLFNPIVDLTDGDWIRFAVGGPALQDRKNTPLPSSEEDRQLARSLSPLFHVRPGQPPTLLMHGRGDRVVDVQQAERFGSAAAAAGNRCDLILPGEEIGHAFVIPGYKYPEEVVVEAVRTADRFLASLGWISGPPTLQLSPIPAWLPKPPTKNR